MKVIISSGGGRLHLADSLAALLCVGIDAKLVVGLHPRLANSRALMVLGRRLGNRDVASSLQRRLQEGRIPPERLLSCAIPEALIHVLYRMADLRLLSRSITQALAWRNFGYWSKRHLGEKGDIFHVRSGAGGGGAINFAKRNGYKVVVDHSIAHPDYISELLTPLTERFPYEEFEIFSGLFWNLVKQDCVNADVLLVNSGFVRDTFVARGFSENKIRVLYLGVREDFIGLKKVYKTEGPLKLLFCGSCGLRKGAHVLFEAVKILSANFDVRLEIVGGIHKGIELCSMFGVRDLVTFTGVVQQEQLKAKLATADIFVFPSLAEGSARAAVEAWAAGLPVVTTPNAGTPIIHGTDGWLVEAQNVIQLAEGIAKLGSSEDLRSTLGGNASRTAAKSYTWAKYGTNLKAIYEDVLYGNS